MKKEYITILDSEKSEVYTYCIDINEIDDTDIDNDLESWIEKIGHNTSNCQWLVHNNKPRKVLHMECISGEYKIVVDRETVEDKIKSDIIDSEETEERLKNEIANEYELNELEEYESGYRDGLSTALRYIE